MLSEDDQMKFMPIDGLGALLRTLFIHIPKSGGTALDNIFADHYFS
jgi:hypothetical protein